MDHSNGCHGEMDHGSTNYTHMEHSGMSSGHHAGSGSGSGMHHGMMVSDLHYYCCVLLPHIFTAVVSFVKL